MESTLHHQCFHVVLRLCEEKTRRRENRSCRCLLPGGSLPEDSGEEDSVACFDLLAKYSHYSLMQALSSCREVNEKRF